MALQIHPTGQQGCCLQMLPIWISQSPHSLVHRQIPALPMRQLWSWRANPQSHFTLFFLLKMLSAQEELFMERCKELLSQQKHPCKHRKL